MTSTWRYVALTCVLAGTSILVSAQASAPATSAVRNDPTVIAAIQVFDAWTTARAAAREEPGLAVGIVYDQELIWSKGYGWADIERKRPSSATTLYRIGSISKLFTDTALMQLRDAGKLHLDDPVAKYLPWFSLKNVQADSPAITIRHLMTHTSGMPREIPGPYWNDLKFPSREDMMRLLPAQETVLPPETTWKYSNIALAVAGDVVSVASGEPYADYIDRHILRPLGMTSTKVVPAPATPRLAIGYRKRVPGHPREPEDFIDARGLTPAANLASSVEDLARFVALQLRDRSVDGAGVLKGSTLREMRRVQWLRPDWKSGQALGFWIKRVGDAVRFGHDGAVPGFKSQVDIDADSRLGVIVLSNGYDTDPLMYVNQAFTIVGPAVAQAKAPDTTAPPAADPRWSAYVGTYTWKHVDVEVLVLGHELTMIVPDADNPWESRVTLKPAGPHTFRMAGGAATGELLTFEMGPNGNAVSLTAGNYYRVRK